MLLRNSNTGDLEVYDIANNQITNAALIGTVGIDWQFSGVGNFSGVPGETDLLLRNNKTGLRPISRSRWLRQPKAGAPSPGEIHSDSVMGWLNSEVAPSADVSVAVNETGSAASLEASTVSANLPLPSVSDIVTTSPRNISPSLLPDARLPNTSTVKRDSGLPRRAPCTVTPFALLRALSSVGAARPPFGGAWQLGAPSGQIFARLPGAGATPMPRLPT
jgi:hypothetical protein